MNKAIELLKELISTPSFSGMEDKTADIIYTHLRDRGVYAKIFLNNVWAKSENYSESKPTLLLNSHHDTVRPSPAYTRNPYTPLVEGGKLYGLGSNDAGGSVVSLIEVFCRLYNADLDYNLVLAITAEEETICKNGISALWEHLGKIDCAVVGEPTNMKGAIAERGLLVLDCKSEGVSGHAARNEGINAIYKAIEDIEWFKTYIFPKTSDLMGNVKMTVTQINAGTQHNVIPSECSFVVDIRPTDKYKNVELVELIKGQVTSEITPRSVNLNASAIEEDHPLVKNARALNFDTFISPTTSDISRIPVPALKMGPGESARSHTANEYIYLKEIEAGITSYEIFLKNLDLK